VGRLHCSHALSGSSLCLLCRDGPLVKILRFSHDYLVNTGGMMAHLQALNAALVKISSVEVIQTFLVGTSHMGELEASGQVERRGQEWIQSDTGIRLFPCVVPMRSKGRTEMDSEEALASFERHLEKLLEREQPDLLHVHIVRHWVQVVALRVARRHGLPSVLTHHDGMPAKSEMVEILREATQLVDRTCAISGFSAAALPGGPVDYQGFFVDRDFWNPAEVDVDQVQRWRRELAPDTGHRLLVYPARFIPRKNHAFLIQGIYWLIQRQAIQDSGLVPHLALPGPTLPERHGYRKSLEAMAERLGVAERISFLGNLAPAALRSLYAASHVVIYPARNEGAGRCHLEGMLLGCCAAVANDGGLVEYLQGGVNGITFSPDSIEELVGGLESLLLSDEFRGRLTAAGRAVAERLTLGRYARDHVELYRELIDEASP